jgi:UDP-N-acetylmuramoyl-tripeptide--D-alanyl-D-alanine ligase
LAAGAVAAIVSRMPPEVPAQAPLIFVEDTFAALQQLGGAGRARSQANFVAVTGSVGKTGSKEMLRLLLSATGDTYANEGNLNNHWGVPLSLARLPAEARFGVFELGMNHAGELGPLSQMVQPHVALITTVEAVHLEFFAAVDAIADAKAEIFLGMKTDGIAVLNRDNAQFARLLSATKIHGLKKTLSFGRDGAADARLIDYIPTPGGSVVKADILGRTFQYKIGAAGAHTALNSLGTLLAAVSLGGDAESCAAMLVHYSPPKGRGVMQTIALADGTFTLIDESYNASPVAMRAAISVLGQITPATGGKRILALGDMRELGATAPQLHASLANDILAAKIDSIFCCGEMMRHLYDALPQDLRGIHAKDSATLSTVVANHIRPGDVIVVKGSLSTNMHLVADALRALGDRATKQQTMAS